MPTYDHEMRDDHENFIDQQLENEKMMNVYSTEKIDQLLTAFDNGDKIDMGFTFHGDIELKNAGIRYDYTQWEFDEIDRCVSDPEYMIEKYCRFMTDYGQITVTLRKYQRELIHLMATEHWDEKEKLFIADNRKVLVMQSRQTGKTSTTVSYINWYVIAHRQRNIVIGANNKDTAEEIMEKIMEVYRGLPWFLKVGIKSMSKKAITFDNGCKIKCVATTSAGGVGKTAHLLMLDEFGVIPASAASNFWTAINPTLSSSKVAQVIILSTPRSKSHKFYELYQGALTGKNDFKTKVVYYWEAGGDRATEEWKKAQIAEVGQKSFDQEFELRFDGGGSRLISAKDMQFLNRISREFETVPIYGIPNNVSQKILWKKGFNPDQLSEEDLVTRKFVLQVDTAGGQIVKINNSEDKDWNVINIYEVKFMSPARIKMNRLGYKEVKLMDCIRFEQVGIYMDHEFNEEFSADAAKHIVFTLLRNGQGSWAGEIDNCRIMIEVNFNGVNWIKKFMKHEMFYPQLIVKTKHSQNAVKKDYGFKTVSGQRGKGYWCEQGAKMVEKRQIIVYQDTASSPQESTIQQLGAFGKNARGQYVGEAMHDDIAVTVVFLSIIMEQEDFQLWIEDWFRLLSETDFIPWERKRHLQVIAQFLDMYMQQTFEDEYSENDIKNLYGNAVSGFGRLTHNNPSNGLPIYAQPRDNNGFGTMRNGSYYSPQQQSGGFGSYSRGTRYQQQYP